MVLFYLMLPTLGHGEDPDGAIPLVLCPGYVVRNAGTSSIVNYGKGRVEYCIS